MELSRLLRCVYPDSCRGSRGFGPLRPTLAHFQFSFHDGMDVRLRGEIGPRTPTPGPIVFRLRRMELSRLLRCVFPGLLSGLERICAPADLPPR